MPSLADHHAAEIAKLIYIGDAGTGKTGSLVSLVGAGYKLRILDMDNGLDSLVAFARKECPDKLDNVQFETRRDTFKSGPAGPRVIRPKAFVEAIKLMQTWSDESDPAEWGKDTIFVLDSLTAFSNAAFEWAKGLSPDAKDPRQWFYAAQKAVEDTIAMLTSEEFKCNVIIISHVNYTERNDGSIKGYASAVGSALGPKLSKYFNTVLLAETKGSGQSVTRKIRTVPTMTVDLKNPVPFNLPPELPLETGLNDLFEILKGTDK